MTCESILTLSAEDLATLGTCFLLPQGGDELVFDHKGEELTFDPKVEELTFDHRGEELIFDHKEEELTVEPTVFSVTQIISGEEVKQEGRGGAKKGRKESFKAPGPLAVSRARKEAAVAPPRQRNNSAVSKVSD